jgi:hypothetical protein
MLLLLAVACLKSGSKTDNLLWVTSFGPAADVPGREKEFAASGGCYGT